MNQAIHTVDGIGVFLNWSNSGEQQSVYALLLTNVLTWDGAEPKHASPPHS